MTTVLVGAGADPDFLAPFDVFAEALPQHRTVHLAVVVHSDQADPATLLAAYTDPLEARLNCRIVPILLHNDTVDALNSNSFEAVDGIVVGGGRTPAYLEGLRGATANIAQRVANGVSYLGFSAGAMVAPGRALTGGYLVNGVEACDEGCSEGISEVQVEDGLGLAPFSIDVHAAQAGTLSRAVAAVDAGLVERVVAIDEGTALVITDPAATDYTVLGSGRCWDIQRRTNSDGWLPGAGVVVVLRTATQAPRSGQQK